MAIVLWICLLAQFARSDDKFCGIYAVYGAGLSLGVEKFDFNELIDERYVSELGGSTAGDLERAAGLMGLAATTHTGLGVESLLAADFPMVLHVMSEGQVEGYNHWILYLGTNAEGISQVVDTPGSVLEIPVSQILGRWDGNAVIVRPKSTISENSQTSVRILFSCLFLAISFAVVSIFRRILSHESVSHFMVIVSLSAVLLATYIAVSKGSLFISRGTSKYLDEAFNKGQFDELFIDDIKRITSNANSEWLVIDARDAHQFSQGSIPRAVNVPYDLEASSLSAIFENTPRDTKIVVFCTRKECFFDSFLGIRISALGFHEIRLFQGGWKEWRENEQF